MSVTGVAGAGDAVKGGVATFEKEFCREGVADGVIVFWLEVSFSEELLESEAGR